jgi:single-stranded DNA-binding protein
MNKVLLTGRLTRDPELRNLASGKQVTTFSDAVTQVPRSARTSGRLVAGSLVTDRNPAAWNLAAVAKVVAGD